MGGAVVLVLSSLNPPGAAQGLFEGPDEILPPELESLYQRGLDHLAKTQSADGSWSGGMGNQPAVQKSTSPSATDW